MVMWMLPCFTDKYCQHIAPVSLVPRPEQGSGDAQ